MLQVQFIFVRSGSFPHFPMVLFILIKNFLFSFHHHQGCGFGENFLQNNFFTAFFHGVYNLPTVNQQPLSAKNLNLPPFFTRCAKPSHRKTF